MIASPLPLAPAPAGFGTLSTSAGADPAASVFAVLLAGLLPMPALVAAVPREPSADLGLPSGQGLTAPPDAPATPPPIPAAALAPALPATVGRAAPQAPVGPPHAADGKVPPAAVPPAAVPPMVAEASAPPPPLAPQAFGLEAEPSPELPSPAGASSPERLAAAPGLVAGLVPLRGERELATLPSRPPVAPLTFTAQAADPTRPSVAVTSPSAAREAVARAPAKAVEALPEPQARAPAAVPQVAPAGAGSAESAPAADAAAEATVEITEIAPGRTARAASEPLAPGQRAAPPPPVQIGLQIASAASRRVERMVVQLEPAALGRVEVRLDFSHDNRVSALIAADRPETLELLQRDGRALERSLQDAGLRLADNALSFSLRQDQRQRQGAGAPPSALRSQPFGSAPVADLGPAQWFRAERVLDIRI